MGLKEEWMKVMEGIDYLDEEQIKSFKNIGIISPKMMETFLKNNRSQLRAEHLFELLRDGQAFGRWSSICFRYFWKTNEVVIYVKTDWTTLQSGNNLCFGPI